MGQPELLPCQCYSAQPGSESDKTGRAGKYDFKLDWTLDEASPAGPVAGPPSDATGPSIFTAVQEQLGLKLESGKGPVEILVIDSVEKPSEN